MTAPRRSSTSTTNQWQSPTRRSCSKRRVIRPVTRPINADIRGPHRLWRQVADTGVIDLTQPVALLMIAVLHFQQRDHEGNDITDRITAQYRDLLPGGSYLAISHQAESDVRQF
jgi:hypothetical protein